MTLGEMVAQYRAQQANQNAQPMPQQAAANVMPQQARAQQAPYVQYPGLAGLLNLQPMFNNRYDMIRGAIF